MVSPRRNVAVIATATSPLLPHLIHALSHRDGISTNVLTRKTSVKISPPSLNDRSHANGTDSHQHTSQITHVQTDFSDNDIRSKLEHIDTIICVLSGSDIHIQISLIDIAASLPRLKLFIPLEFALNTSNATIRELLPPYRTKFQIQQKLRKSGLKWKAVYSGICLEEGMKSDGVLGIDVLWGSVVCFPGFEDVEIPISRLKNIAMCIVSAITDENDEVEVKSGVMTSLDEIVEIVEKELGKEIDKYEGDLEGAQREAKVRMKMGFFDGGVALMSRFAIWDKSVGAWEGWIGEEEPESWEQSVRNIVRAVRDGSLAHEGCGC